MFDQTNENRGQVIIITAIVISMIILGSVGYLNLAGFTQYEQNKPIETHVADTEQSYQQIERAISSSIQHANNNDSLGGYTARTDTVDKDILYYNDNYNRLVNKEGESINLTSATYTEGTLIKQNSYNNLSIANDSGGGTLPPGLDNADPNAVENAAAFTEYNLYGNAEETRSLGFLLNGETTPDPSNPFLIDLENTSTEIYVQDADPNDNTINVTITNSTDTITKFVKATDEEPASIAISHQTVNGEYVSTFPDHMGITGIYIENGDRVSAKFYLVTYPTGNVNTDLLDNKESIQVEENAIYSMNTYIESQSRTGTQVGQFTIYPRTSYRVIP